MNIFIVMDICFLVAFVIFLIVDDNVPWTYVIVGFAMGITLYETLTFFRERNRPKRKLR